MSEQLFVYGTLRKDSANSVHEMLERNARFVAYARTRGRLYDLGEYPGLIPADADSWVHGDLYELADPSAVLARLDEYEGCGPNDPKPHEYERVRREVLMDTGGRETAWVYVYRGGLAGSREIRSGDYCRPGDSSDN